ncbi:MAG: TetR/AcrR family transcriptional regulator [Clostridia bacterium]|nr:TetR/AcrR family transcriptional regulator [Clostridia bacterium]
MNSNSIDTNNPKMRIMNAAEKVFVDKGYDGARVEEIAKEAAINKSQLFYYYGSKENILKELVKKHIDEAVDIIHKTFDRNTLNSKQAFEQLIDHLAYFFEKKESILKIVFIEMLKGSSNDFSLFELFSPLFESISMKTQGMGREIADREKSIIEFFYFDIMPIALFVTSRNKFSEFYSIAFDRLSEKFFEIYRQTQTKYFERMQKSNKDESM